MQLHEIPSIKKKTQRIGRSGKRGSYSGRGVKGQKSRAGRRLYPAERDLIMRLPKRRGFRNIPKTEKNTVLNLGDLSLKIKSFTRGKGPLSLNQELLKVAGLVGKNFKGEIKLLGGGEIAFPVDVQGLKVSKSAKIKIEKAGGSVK
ncbi:MAG: uL15 family ribosomal protein [Minisyncoccia bacterium]|jgi:large subunit ribosomal protein L15